MSNASDLASLAEEMAAAYTQRKQDIARVVSDAKDLIAEAAEQDRARAGEVADLKAATGVLLSACAAAGKTRAKEVADLKAATGTLLSDYAEGDKTRANEVAGLKASADSLVAEFHAEQAETKAAWQGLLGTMRSARGGKVAKTPRPAKVEAPAVAEKLAEHIEEAISPDELKKQVLKMIRSSKDEGIKLGVVAKELGLESWRDVAPAAQELLEEDKVEKIDSLYFPL